ncbi:hypothetical protein [Acidiphilium sp.]|uniref:hypothetical protein n=1 Tax=Acidiphilium sp. TaxID=527 RepID=UPI003D02CBC7
MMSLKCMSPVVDGKFVRAASFSGEGGGISRIVMEITNIGMISSLGYGDRLNEIRTAISINKLLVSSRKFHF